VTRQVHQQQLSACRARAAGVDVSSGKARPERWKTRWETAGQPRSTGKVCREPTARSWLRGGSPLRPARQPVTGRSLLAPGHVLLRRRLTAARRRPRPGRSGGAGCSCPAGRSSVRGRLRVPAQQAALAVSFRPPGRPARSVSSRSTCSSAVGSSGPGLITILCHVSHLALRRTSRPAGSGARTGCAGPAPGIAVRGCAVGTAPHRGI